jgi:hypothetical protein
MGSLLAATAWQHWHWAGVCAVGFALVLVAGAAHVLGGGGGATVLDAAEVLSS